MSKKTSITSAGKFPRNSSANTQRIANYSDDYVPIGVASAMAGGPPEPAPASHTSYDMRSVDSESSISSANSQQSLQYCQTTGAASTQHSNLPSTECAAGQGASLGSSSARPSISTVTDDPVSRSSQSRHVMVLPPDQSKPKPTGSRRQTVNASDIGKTIQKCKDEAVERLDVSRSQLTMLPPSIRELTNLRELYLYQNKLTTLPLELGCLTELITLGASENSLAGLPDSLVNLRKLRVLDLRHNKLTDIPPVVYQLTSLKTLYLRFNRIKQVESDIGRLTSLTMLSLRDNKIDGLPAAIGRLTNLVGLDISYNHLKSVPIDIGNCAQLQSLDLQHNELRQLPPSLGNLKALNRLGLRYNQLESLPSSLVSCSLIEEFNIESNIISVLPEGLLSSLVNLSSVTLSRNKFDGFPVGGPMQFKSVTSFSMELNHVTNIPYGIFSRAECLTNLNMSCNQLNSLPLDIKTWNKIVELNLGTNQVCFLVSNVLYMSTNYTMPKALLKY